MANKVESEKQADTICRAIQTAYGWSAGSGKGLQLYSFASCRMVHSEDHRAAAIKDVEDNILWNKNWTGTPDEANDPARDIPLLEELMLVLKQAKIKKELISDQQYMAYDKRVNS